MNIPFRFLLLLLALHSVTSSKDTFLQFARDHAKTYSSIDEFKTRQTIFESNYLDMLEHNQRYEKGEVSWARKVTKFYDRTMEEFIADVGLGNWFKKFHYFQCLHYHRYARNS